MHTSLPLTNTFLFTAGLFLLQQYSFKTFTSCKHEIHNLTSK